MDVTEIIIQGYGDPKTRSDRKILVEGDISKTKYGWSNFHELIDHLPNTIKKGESSTIPLDTFRVKLEEELEKRGFKILKKTIFRIDPDWKEV